MEEPDYRGLVLRSADDWIAGGYADPVPLLRRGYIRRVSEMAAALARAWQWTGQPRYADQALRRLQAILDAWQSERRPGKPWKRVCFFSVYPIFDAYHILDAGGRLDPEFRTRFRQFLPEGFFPLERGVFNQAFARAAGLALAGKLSADLPEAAAWRAYAREVWNDWHTLHDMAENAAGYNGISLWCLFLLADAGGFGPLDSAPLVSMFRRFRDQVAPSGAMPEYGDSGGTPWGAFHGWGHWVAAFERAARQYRDPTFRWAAVRMFHAATRFRALDQPSYAIDSTNIVYALAFADAWRDATLTPQVPRAGTLVSLRNMAGGGRAPDKLILAPSREPAAPFAMAELCSRGYHAHDSQWGSILHYEVDDQPLLVGLGYHNRCPEHANLVLVCPAGEPFPHRVPLAPAGMWQEASLAVRRIAAGGAENGAGRRCHFDRVILRVADDRPVDLWIDNLRLSGPAGQRMLDDFEQPGPWRGGRRTLDADAVQGSHSLRISCQPGVTFIWRGGLDGSFSLDDYDRIKFSWKLAGAQRIWTNSFVFRLDTSLSEYHVPGRQLAAEVEEARAETRGPDQFGTLRLAKWFTEDSRLTRRLVLLGEGPLVVCDQLQAGASAEGQAAGPLWHLPCRPEQGRQWFDAEGWHALQERGAQTAPVSGVPSRGVSRRDAAARRRLLVWFAPVPGQTVGVQTVELWGHIRPYTVFAKQALHGGRPARFLTVLVPHRDEEPAADWAKTISVATPGADQLIVKLGPPGHSAEIQMGPGDSLSVRR
jgi:hypothetical protein